MEKTIYTRLYKRILKRLIQARTEANLTQNQVAKMLGKHQSFISKCESGERRVDLAELKIISKIYKKTMDFFVE